MKKKTVGRFFLFIAIVIASAFGLLLYLPFGKEGASWSDLPVFLGVMLAALALAAMWWLAVGFSLRKALIGWAFLFLPFAAHGSTAISIIFERYTGHQLAKQVQIAGYHEEPILWPGFDGPIGYTITFDLKHPRGLKRLINPPEIRMGPPIDIPYEALSATQTSGSGYFKDSYLGTKTGNLAILKTVLFQRIFEDPAAKNDFLKWSSYQRFNPQGKTRLAYNLLPGIVDHLPSQDHICLNARVEGLEICAKGIKPQTGCASPNYLRLADPIYAEGTDLTALWLAPPSLDMSKTLTSMLHAHSKLQSNPAEWQAIHQRLTPAGLKQAGYSVCAPGKDSHTAWRFCFCRPQVSTQ